MDERQYAMEMPRKNERRGAEAAEKKRVSPE
jgi:hypothetical protein